MRTSSLIISWIVWITLAVAHQGAFDDQANGAPQTLSSEALEACRGLEDGAPCRFSLDQDEVRGVCRCGSPGAPAACIASPASQAYGLPAEAVRACSALADGATQ
jgi:hypothetical protein